MVLCSILIYAGIATTPASPDYIGAFVRGLNDTGMAVAARSLATAASGNVVVSPFGVATAHLTLAYGCRGNDREDLLKGLGMATPTSDEDLLGAIRLQNALTADSGNRFILANTFATLDDVKTVDAFRKELEGAPSGGFLNVDEADSIEFINDWVSDKTLGRVQRILGRVPENLGLLMMNAATYDGEWAYPFVRASVNRSAVPNYIDRNGTPVLVDMMTRPTADTPWVAQPDFDAVLLPYRDEAFAMVVAVPRGKSGPLDVLQAWKGDGWRKTIEGMTVQKVYVTIPRFTARGKTDLVDALGALGVKRIFSGFDPQGIVQDVPSWKVSMDVHEAFLVVDRSGTHAAQAPVAERVRGGLFTDYKKLMANRPFVYALYHVKTGAVAFVGVCSDPPHLN